VNIPEGAAAAILDEIVSGVDIPPQSPPVKRSSGYQGFDFPMKTAIENSSFGWLHCVS